MKHLKRLVFLLLTSIIFSMTSMITFATTIDSKIDDLLDEPIHGFVEFQTDASINFEEVIEVVLTDQENDLYYSHRLYRINDYGGTLVLPFGTYTVTAKVIANSGEILPNYAAVCLTEEVIIEDGYRAIPISLRVDEFINADVNSSSEESLIEQEEDFIEISEIEESEAEDSLEDTVESLLISDTEENVAESELSSEKTEDDTPKYKPTKSRTSMYASLIFSLILIVIAVVVVYIKKSRD